MTYFRAHDLYPFIALAIQFGKHHSFLKSNVLTQVSCQPEKYQLNDQRAPRRLGIPEFARKLFHRQHTETDLFSEVVDRTIAERKRDLCDSSCYSNNNVQPNWLALRSKWITLLKKIHEISNKKTSIGNRLTLIYESPIDHLIQEIDKAKERVWAETYIFDDSVVGKAFIDALINAKHRGCDVILLVDRLGSLNMRNEWKQLLKDSKVQFIEFNDWRRVGFRDHRKIAIIDNNGYCGSANIMMECASPQHKGTNKFFEVHLKIEGPAVAHLADVFRDSISGCSEIDRDPIQPPPPISFREGGGTFVQVLESRPGPNHHVSSIQFAHRNTIHKATSIYVMPGYFLPPWLLRRQIKSAVKGGAYVSFCLSGNSDVWGDTQSAKAVLSRYMKWGDNIRAFFTSERHCHAKTLIVDGVWSSVGSFNWDRHSGRRNLEVALGVFDARFAKQLECLHRSLTRETHLKTMMTPTKSPVPLDPWQAVEHQSLELLNWAHAPQTYEFKMSDWKSHGLLTRIWMKLISWCLYTSGGPLLDDFPDEDQQAWWDRRRLRWEDQKLQVHNYFLFGPSQETIEMLLYQIGI